MNTIQILRPYDFHGTWVFDDPEKGLLREPFVWGMSEMIDVMVEDIPNAHKGFVMFFSIDRPPLAEGVHHLKFMGTEQGGAWYRDVETRMGGWLCPATLKYFEKFPKEMFVWCDWCEPVTPQRRKYNEQQSKTYSSRVFQRLSDNSLSNSSSDPNLR